MELLETVAIAFPSDDKWKCPFDHQKKKVKALKSVVPPHGKNDANLLGKNLTGEYHFFERIKIKVNGKPHEAQYTPHHLIPGNASWPKTQLLKWVHKDEKHIIENIGYDVNEQYNGVSLPGNNGYENITGQLWSTYAHKEAYAFACMDAASYKHQFHDAHSKYNEFVTGVLDKIYEKLNDQIKNTKYPGCDKKNCAGKKKQKKPYDPPIELMERLKNVALRLERYLLGDPRKWKMPIYTSRFSLMYQKNITEKEARKKMSEHKAR